MLQNLELSEYLGEAVHMAASDEWLDTMMQKLYQGQRNYFLKQDERAALTIQAGFDAAGNSFSNVWYVSGENQVTFVSRAGSVVQVMTTGLAEGAYNGAFEIWTINSATGDVYREQGTFSNNVVTGEYTAAVHQGSEAGDAFDLWSNREGLSYVTYTGAFDSEGKTTLEQPSESAIARLLSESESERAVVFAYGEDESDCLFAELSGDTQAEGYLFSIDDLGVGVYPSYTLYEAADAGQAQEDAAMDGENGTDENSTEEENGAQEPSQGQAGVRGAAGAGSLPGLRSGKGDIFGRKEKPKQWGEC